MKTIPSHIRYNSTQIKLNDWSLIEVTGNDREQFFQGQVTNDLSSLLFGESQLTARLNRTGKLQSFFTIARLQERLLILCQNELVEKIQNDFNKFIIMDDVELKKLDEEIYLCFNAFITGNQSFLFNLKFFGIEAVLGTKPFSNVPFTDNEELEVVRVLNGYPLWNKDVDESLFVNDSCLNDLAVSYKKGCFLGQETVAKIENNRGAAFFPVLLRMNTSEEVSLSEFYLEDKKIGKINYQIENLLQATLLRDHRVLGKKLTILVNGKKLDVTVDSLPYFKNQSRASIAEELYHLGVDSFKDGQTDHAMELMKKAIVFNPEYSDAYESIGVILGRQERYLEAIEWMDKLLSVKNNSVMAHTNKSLFLMKLGKIEEAEAEKALATVKSFSMYGEEAKLKKALEEEKKKKEEDLARREKMFLQVLEIDSDDSVALFGMGDIAFYREQFKAAVDYLEKVVQVDEKYSAAYLLLGKSLEATGNLERAMLVYKKGIDVASKKGDMMPANEMQSRLNQLVVASRLA